MLIIFVSLKNLSSLIISCYKFKENPIKQSSYPTFFIRQQKKGHLRLGNKSHTFNISIYYKLSGQLVENYKTFGDKIHQPKTFKQ